MIFIGGMLNLCVVGTDKVYDKGIFEFFSKILFSGYVILVEGNFLNHDLLWWFLYSDCSENLTEISNC